MHSANARIEYGVGRSQSLTETLHTRQMRQLAATLLPNFVENMLAPERGHRFGRRPPGPPLSDSPSIRSVLTSDGGGEGFNNACRVRAPEIRRLQRSRPTSR
jgi:hypothetical protein